MGLFSVIKFYKVKNRVSEFKQSFNMKNKSK